MKKLCVIELLKIKKKNRRDQLKKIQLESTGKIKTTTKSKQQRMVKYSHHDLHSAGLVLQIKKKNRRYQLKKIPTSSTGTIK